MAMGSGGEDLGHVRQLVERGLFADEYKAEQFLSEIGVRHAMGVYSESALARAMQRLSTDASTFGVPSEHRQFSDAESCLRHALTQFGLRIAALTSGRTTLATIVAIGDVRTITVETTGDPLVIDAEHGVRARVYVADERRTGQAAFMASGFVSDEKSPLFLFSLPCEGRFWVARREDLRSYDAELRLAAKGQRGRRRYPQRPGFAPHRTRDGYLRVSIGLAGLPGLEPHLRITDAEGRFVVSDRHMIGGRPQ